ncbi:MAG TPA: hypothetical protein VKE22_18875 [Haliangiales bacterium]|nr:hypothetical protein [Haliangiales bacterium]
MARAVVVSLVIVAFACGSPAASQGPDAMPTEADAMPTPGPACDGQGVPAIPAGFPQLGAHCLAHFTYHEDVVDPINYAIEHANDEDYSADRGVRPLHDGSFTGFDLGLHEAPAIPIAIFLPRLDPGVYRRADGAEIWSGDIAGIQEFYTGVWCGSLRLEIDGRANGVIWGRFISDGYDAANLTLSHITQGLFAAKIETIPSTGDVGTPWNDPMPSPPECSAPYDMCSVVPECPAKPACVDVACGDMYSGIVHGYCENTAVDARCPAQERCDVDQGCVSI